jgi:cold shock CspA family protein
MQQGDLSGEVVSYNGATGDLELASGQGGQPMRFTISNDAKFERKGQGSFVASPSGPADLQRGALVSLQFQPDGKGHATVNVVTVLATPGSEFVFSGNLVALDMHVGSMVLLDPNNNQTYQIEFNAGSLASMPDIRTGQRVRVAAEYDGTRYVAHNVTAY